MIVTRKEKETNQQVLRRFNRIATQDAKLKIVRDRKYFVKEPNRFARLQGGIRREVLRKLRQWY